MLTYNNFYIIGIDPGNNTGISIFELSSIDMSILSISTYTVILNNMIVGMDILLERNLALNKICSCLYDMYIPKAVAVEAAFLNSRFPKAVMQLSQYTSTIDQAFYNKDNFIKILRYPPKYIKKCIGGGGNADKDGMLRAVKNIPELLNNVNLDRLTEHEIDALAIGYVSITELRRSPHILMSF